MAFDDGERAIKDRLTLPDSPFWILRHHVPNAIHQVRAIKSDNGVLIAAGDSHGRISLTSLRDYRPRYFWNAHKESILGIDLLSFDGKSIMISSGRDNQLHVFSLSALRNLTSAVLPSRIQADLPIPECLQSLDINSLNYCSFSARNFGNDEDAKELMVAVPHTVDSGYIDVYDVKSLKRIAIAIGKADMETSTVKASRAAIVMSMQILSTNSSDDFSLIAGYEDGYVKLWRVEKGMASLQWSARKHTESVMALAVSENEDFCVSVAADFQVVLYDMIKKEQTKVIRSNSAGHACVAIRKDGEMIAVGGWDGCIRLYDAHLTQLGSLRYHKDTVQALSFVQTRNLGGRRQGKGDEDDHFDDNQSDDTDEEEVDQMEGLSGSLLVSGGKEGRICLWKI